MEITQSNQTSDAIQQFHEQFSGLLRRQAEQIEKLDQSLKLLQTEQQQLEEASSHLLGPLESFLASGDHASVVSPSVILACVRKLGAAACIKQVLEALVEEVARMNVRAAVFDVRGRAAWGASASGFDPELSGMDLRTLVVPLNHDGPFRQAFESAEAVETRIGGLEKNSNLLVKLAPASDARILLIPVRSVDFVAAILYAETGEQRVPALIDSLKVMAEFAGTQIDRLMVVHGGFSLAKATPETGETGTSSEQAAGDEAQAIKPEAPSPEVSDIESFVAGSATPPSSPSEAEQVSTAWPEITQSTEEPPAPATAVDVTLSTDEEKIHRDARRFSRLLVSEIELYNKDSVEEGRRNRDLYQRLKKDIDRSRETYEKRFAHTIANRVDYFYEELVRTLAENDPLLLGSGYPGPSV